MDRLQRNASIQKSGFLQSPRLQAPDGFTRGSTMHVPRRQAMIQWRSFPERPLFAEPHRPQNKPHPTSQNLSLQQCTLVSLQNPKQPRKTLGRTSHASALAFCIQPFDIEI
jgi:hypothetical protein